VGSGILEDMSDTSNPEVLRLKDYPGMYTVIAPDQEAHNLSPNYGVLTKEEVKTLLAKNFGKSPAEIEKLIKDADERPPLPGPFGGVLHSGA
jgi:hypothetical protein